MALNLPPMVVAYFAEAMAYAKTGEKHNARHALMMAKGEIRNAQEKGLLPSLLREDDMAELARMIASIIANTAPESAQVNRCRYPIKRGVYCQEVTKPNCYCDKHLKMAEKKEQEEWLKMRGGDFSGWYS